MIRRAHCRIAAVVAAAVTLLLVSAHAETVTVTLNQEADYYYSFSVSFTPASVTINVGDTVNWDWQSGPHSVTSGVPGQPSGLFDSGIQPQGHSFSHTFTQAGDVP